MEILNKVKSALLSMQRHSWEQGTAMSAFWELGDSETAVKLARERLINRTRGLIASVAEHIRDDGLAHNVLDNCNTFVEANLPQMLAYAIYRGISSGWLNTSYLEFADKCRLAACAKVDDYGFVRDVCGAPTFDKLGIAPEGQAFFMLMHAAYNHVRG